LRSARLGRRASGGIGPDALREDNARLIEELESSRARIVSAADEERRRLERDLHDGAQQQLVLVRLKLSMAERLISKDPAAAEAAINDLREDLDRALAELRDLAHGIYPAVLESDGLVGALREAVWRAAIPTDLESDSVDRVRPEVEAAVYFCCLEALQNAAKHAGPGARARIDLTIGDSALVFEIRDDGVGFVTSPGASSHGLQNMTDRVGAVGGTLRIESEPGRGTRIVGEVPLASAARAVPLPRRLSDAAAREMVGRAEELERLRSMWQESCSGRARVALITGEPGIGKTRLATAIAEHVLGEGGRALFGECEPDPELVYQPWVAALGRDAGGRSLVTLRGLTGASGELLRLLPELRERLPDLAEPIREEPERQKHRLFAAVARYLRLAADEQPLVVVIEDLHWADRQTLDLLRFLTGQLDEAPVFFVGTFRRAEAEDALAELVADLNQRAASVEVPLSGLEPADVELMVRDRLSIEPPAGLSAALQQHTDGNAFFLEEVIRDLAGQPELSAASVRGVPVSVQATIARSLSRLSEPARGSLSIAAVVGRQFDLELVAEVADEHVDTVLEALREAVGRGLLRELPSRAGMFAFEHALVREVLQADIGPARAARLHLRVGEALERLRGQDREPPHAEIAHHLLASEDRTVAERAAAHAEAAGHRAMDRLGYAQAADFFAQAIAAVEMSDGRHGEDPRLCGLLLHLGNAQRRAGDPAHRQTLLSAARLAQSRGDGPALARAALANSRGIFPSFSTAVDQDRVGVLEAALAAIGPEDSSVKARLLASLALELDFVADVGRRAQLADEALDLARRSGDAATLAGVLLSRYWTVPSASLSERISNADEALRLTEDLGDPTARSRALSLRFRVAMEGSDPSEAARCFEANAALVAELREPGLQWVVAVQRAGRALLAGGFEPAEQLTEEAFELGRRAGQLDARLFYTVELAAIRFEQGRTRELASALDEMALRHPRSPIFRTLLAIAQWEAGDGEQARAALDEEAADDFAEVMVDPTWLACLCLFGLLAAGLSDVDNAHVLAERLAPHALDCPTLSHGGVVLGSTSHYLGILATAVGRYDDAERHFTTASAIHDRLAAPAWIARTDIERARMLTMRREHGDVERGQALLDAAQKEFASLGLVLWRDRSTAILGSGWSGADALRAPVTPGFTLSPDSAND
jgi:tetratricopeptide (TPR) repeat protein